MQQKLKMPSSFIALLINHESFRQSVRLLQKKKQLLQLAAACRYSNLRGKKSISCSSYVILF
jgi:hypothetical protein